jgi:hypothetical protein
MSPEVGILFGTLVLVGLTAVLVAYTPFGRDVRRHSVPVTAAVWKGISNAYQRWADYVKGRQLFWTVALVVLAVWMLALSSHAYDLMARQVGHLEIGLLVSAGLASVAALVVAYTRGTDERYATVGPQLGEAAGAGVAVNREEAKAKRIKDLRRQAWAKTSAMHKYGVANQALSTLSDEVTTLNSLIYRLVGEGEDVSAFTVPHSWMTHGRVENARLAPHLEAFMIYLNSVTV